MGVTGLPATVFLESNGEPITLLPGYVEPKMFLDVIEYIGTGAIKKGIAFDEWLKKKGANEQ